MLIIISGPPGSGKTHAAEVLAGHLPVAFLHDEGQFPQEADLDLGIHIVTRQLCGRVPDWAQQENDPSVLRLYTQEAKLAHKAHNWDRLRRRIAPMAAADEVDLIAIGDAVVDFYENERL